MTPAERKFKSRKASIMGIIVNLDVMMAKRKISLTELANQVDLTQANLSILKNNKAKAIRFSTLESLSLIHISEPTRPY